MSEKLSGNYGYKITIGIMAAVILVLTFLLVSQQRHAASRLQASDEQKFALQDELDSLIAEHQRVKASYGDLSDSLSEKDSIINIKTLEIRKLLNTKYELAQVRQKLEQLRLVTQGYEKQIDSLYTVNRELKTENEQIKINYQHEQVKTADLSKEKEELNKKISSAAILKAYNVRCTAYKAGEAGREKVTDKAARTDKIKVCFTVSENQLVPTSYRRFFVRIARPGDNAILTRGASYTWKYHGETLQFSAMESVSYSGESMDICTYFEKPAGSGELPKGRYIVDVFTDDYAIGQGSLELK
ncbi:MAG TPA: hypothetical protein PLJ84_02465 [Bacteroidales bacterium]|nr:hypothetical protein [Bacteroidales bacterium]HPT01432.1 hypothetical protein [Bacteroidales bacterium]